MFEKIIETISSFDKAMRVVYDRYENAQKELPKNYRGEMLQEKLNQATKDYNFVKLNELESYKKIIDEEFNTYYNKINDIITQPVNTEFSSTLEALKSSKNDISNYEAKLYLDKYKNNYTSCKAIIGLLHSVNKASELNIVNADAIKQELDDLKESLLSFAYNYDPNRLSTSLYLKEETSPISISQQKVEAFFNQDFLMSH